MRLRTYASVVIASLGLLFLRRSTAKDSTIASIHKSNSISTTYTYSIYMLAVCILTSGIYTLFILPSIESLHFTQSTSNTYVYSLKSGFFVVLSLILYGLVCFMTQLIKRNRFFIVWSVTASSYFLLMLIPFFALYPGHWMYDQFYILTQAVHYNPETWHGLLSTIFYTYSLYLIPSVIGIAIIQLIIISLIVGYLVSTIYINLQSKWLILFPIAIFVAIPTILNNLYPLRLTLYGYAELLLVTNTILLIIGYRHIKNPYIDIISTATIVGILATWRSEGAIYLLFIVLYLFAVNIRQIYRSNRILTVTSGAIACIIIILLVYIGSVNTAPRYKLTATLGTVSNMLRYPLDGSDVQDKIVSINKVIDVNLFKHLASYEEIPAFWTTGALRPDYARHINEYNEAVEYLILHNPDVFLKVRTHTFLSTNSIGSNQAPMTSSLFLSSGVPRKELLDFYTHNPEAAPINLPLKQTITTTLLQTDEQYRPKPSAAIIWTVIPTICALILTVVVAAYRKQLLISSTLSFLLLHALLIYLTAPANYFMYYFFLYIAGGISVIIYWLHWWQNLYWGAHEELRSKSN